MKVEYPKYLYKHGHEPVVVADAVEHEDYSDWHESPQESPEVEAPKRRGRPPKDK